MGCKVALGTHSEGLASRTVLGSRGEGLRDGLRIARLVVAPRGLQSALGSRRSGSSSLFHSAWLVLPAGSDRDLGPAISWGGGLASCVVAQGIVYAGPVDCWDGSGDEEAELY